MKGSGAKGGDGWVERDEETGRVKYLGEVERESEEEGRQREAGEDG